MVMRPRRNHLLLTSALVGGAFLKLGNSAHAAESTYRFDIPAEPLSQALTDFSQVASQQIIYSEELIRGRSTPGLHGTHTVGQRREGAAGGNPAEGRYEQHGRADDQVRRRRRRGAQREC